MGEKAKKDKLKIEHISKRAFKKFVFPEEFCVGGHPGGEQIEREYPRELQSMVAELLEEDGRFYVCYLNKEPIGYVVIEKVREEFENDWAYRLKDFYLASDKEGYRAEIKAFLMAELKEVSEWYDCHIIIWEEEVIRRKKVKVGSTVWVFGPLMGISLGMLFGIIFDNVGVGVAIGFAIGYALSAGWTTMGEEPENAAGGDVADDNVANENAENTENSDEEDTGGGTCR